MNYLQLILFTAFLAKTKVNAQESPCPRIFTYEAKGPEPDRWYGVITLLNDNDLSGVWLRVIFDRPVLQLGNWFGEVVTTDHKDFLIRNRNFHLKAHTPRIVRVYVRYNVSEPPPRLTGFRLNARTVCPEDLSTTTPSTTTEQLYTSLELEASATAASVELTPQATVAAGAAYAMPFNNGPIYTASANHKQDEASKATEQPLPVLNENLDQIFGTVVEHHRQEKYVKQVANKGEFPWHAALYHAKGITIAYLCGASLISRYHLLTVAHCIVKSHSQVPINPDRLVVYLGKYYVKHWAHEGTETRYVTAITPHPSYNSKTYENDIAVLKLHSPADFSNVVRPVCLWKDSEDFSSVIGRPGTVVGWGFDDTGTIEEKLMHIQMIPQGTEVCNTSLINYSERFQTGKTYCANFLVDSANCVGDSGGGMVFPRIIAEGTKPVWQLRGLVKLGVVLQHQLKCDPDHYVVFTDTAKYLDWIKYTTNT